MTDVTGAILAIISAESLGQTAALALDALTATCRPSRACILIWDAELGRYIVGHTHGDDPAATRRRALQLAAPADHQAAAMLAPDVFYQPFNDGPWHVGALVSMGGAPDTDDPDYAALVVATSRALNTITRLEQAQHEHLQLEAEQERLEQLLAAVDKQQRTIDRLLAAEREFSARLEAVVAERTAELRAAQERLIQSEKLAVIGKLASSLAHEINNPLQAMRSGLGLVMEDIAPDSATAQDLRTIHDELERIEQIFRQMLDLNRPVVQERVPVDVNQICQGVHVLLRKRLQQASIGMELELDAALPSTCGDPNQIKQVVLNLALNAAEAIPDGQRGHITLGTAHTPGQVHIRVIDDGSGIDPAYQQLLFEPLFTTKTRGLGLGLAISQDIVQQHGGHISVESTPHRGTTFTIALPTNDEDCHGKHTDR